jgi:hypothetical protein
VGRAGIIIHFDEERIEKQCIEFDSGEQITGYDLLELTNNQVIASFSSMGAAICKIDDKGCQEDDCFCDSPPNYWSYWHLKNGVWEYSGLGSSTYQVEDGDVEGWAWGPGEPPQLLTFEDICQNPSITPTPTITFTPTTKPLATMTQVPASTLSPTPQINPTQSTPGTLPSATNQQAVETQITVSTPIPPQNEEISSSRGSPNNPRLILPAQYATLEINPELIFTPTQAPISLSVVSSSINENPDHPNLNNATTGFSNYIAFGVLAVSLSAVILIKNVMNKR